MLKPKRIEKGPQMSEMVESEQKKNTKLVESETKIVEKRPTNGKWSKNTQSREGWKLLKNEECRLSGLLK